MRPCDILAHCSTEELHILREVPDIAGQLRPRPREDVRAIKTHMPGETGPRTYKKANEGGFAGRRWSDDPERLSGQEIEVHIGDNCPRRARDAVSRAFDLDAAQRRRKRHTLVTFWRPRKKLCDPFPRHAHGHDVLPDRDGRFYRGERPSAEYGGRNHDPAGCMKIEYQQSAYAQKRNLYEKAHRLGDAGKQRILVGGSKGGLQRIHPDVTPAADEGRRHADTLEHICVADPVFGKIVCPDRKIDRFAERPACQDLIERRDSRQDGATHKHKNEICPVQIEQHDEKHDQKGSIEKRGEPRAANERAKCFHIPKALARGCTRRSAR